MFARGHQPILTNESGSTNGGGWFKTITILLIAAPTAYYTYVEVFRAREVKRRRLRFDKQQRARGNHHHRKNGAANAAAKSSSSSSELNDANDLKRTSSSNSTLSNVNEYSKGDVDQRDNTGRRGVCEEEYDEIKEMYAPYVLGGRYVNALGPEWREQGAWEWVAWKLIWAPLNGTLFWNAGVPKDLNILAESLPIEEPDFKLLFGTDKARVDAKTEEGEEIREAPPATRDLSESWDRLSSNAPSVSSGGDSPVDIGGNSRRSSASERGTTTRAIGNSTLPEAGEDLTATWIGQSTTFLQLDGVGILTDPVFAFRTVDTFLAPPRLCPPPCPLSALLSIQLVLVSHDHFDHVHPDDVRFIGDSAHWVVPTGMGRFLRSLGVTRYTELTWWQTTVIEFNVRLKGGRSETRKLNITATPAQHWSSRGPLDTNQSLWCSYVVEGKDQSIFHAGDTGYNATLFNQIGRIFGPIDLALLPIGSYSPRWHMISQHCNPYDAVRIHRDLKAKKSLAQHWGTWILSDEHYLEPPKMLQQAKEEFGLREDEFEATRPGRTLCLRK